jgi:hypothetical protein
LRTAQGGDRDVWSPAAEAANIALDLEAVLAYPDRGFLFGAVSSVNTAGSRGDAP